MAGRRRPAPSGFFFFAAAGDDGDKRPLFLLLLLHVPSALLAPPVGIPSPGSSLPRRRARSHARHVPAARQGEPEGDAPRIRPGPGHRPPRSLAAAGRFPAGPPARGRRGCLLRDGREYHDNVRDGQRGRRGRVGAGDRAGLGGLRAGGGAERRRRRRRRRRCRCFRVSFFPRSVPFLFLFFWCQNLALLDHGRHRCSPRVRNRRRAHDRAPRWRQGSNGIDKRLDDHAAGPPPGAQGRPRRRQGRDLRRRPPLHVAAVVCDRLSAG